MKQAKTPLSTLLKKASENRVLRDAKLVSMANRKYVSCFSLVSNARTDDNFASILALLFVGRLLARPGSRCPGERWPRRDRENPERR